MKELIVLSGKGGTGKTSITASFAHLSPSRVLVDADVDAADLHLVVSHNRQKTEAFSGGILPEVDAGQCIGCGMCQEVCTFSAILMTEENKATIDPVRCEGCGVCHHFCPQEAISLLPRISGDWFLSDTPKGPMVHAKLGIAEENSGKLVTLLRKTAREIAEKSRIPHLIVDGPPGIGCPVIASITGSDLVLVITEPTVSGRHDMERVIRLCSRMGIPLCVAVNKWDLNPEMAELLAEEARKSGIPVVGKIPFDPAVTAAMVREKSLVETSDGPASRAVRKLWCEVEKQLATAAPTAAIGGTLS